MKPETFTIQDVAYANHLFQLTPKERYQMYVNQQTFNERNVQTHIKYNGSSVPLYFVKDLYIAATISAIAYNTTQTSTQAAVEAIGAKFIGFYSNISCQAYICFLKDGRQVLALQGTEFTWKYHNLWQVWDDLSILPKYITKRGPGQPFIQYVHSGFYDDLALLWEQIGPLLDYEKDLWICGHSLGGCRAHLARRLVPQNTKVRITTFGAPKAANEAFWNQTNLYNTTIERVLADRDFGGDWQPMLPYSQPNMQFYWLTQNTIQLVNQRHYLNLSMADHSILHSYLPKLKALID